MSTEADDAKMWAELDHLILKPATASDIEANRAADVEKMLKSLDDLYDFVDKNDDKPALVLSLIHI